MSKLDAFDTALVHFEEAAEQTRLKYANNPELHDAVAYIYEDVSRCLRELKSAVVLREQDKSGDEGPKWVVQT